MRYKHGVGYRAVAIEEEDRRASRFAEGDIVCLDRAPQSQRPSRLVGVWQVMSVDVVGTPHGFSYMLGRVAGPRSDWHYRAGPFLDLVSPAAPKDRDDTAGWELLHHGPPAPHETLPCAA